MLVCSGLRPLRDSGKEREHKKFIIYCAYAWGSPFIILSVSMVMQFCDFVPDNYIKPRFGVEKCWFKGMVTVPIFKNILIVIHMNDTRWEN